jgi:hypothetical protein
MATKHTLFGADDAETMRPLLRYLNGHNETLKRMGVDLAIRLLSASQRKSPEIVAALRKRGVTALPCLMTTGGVYIGARDIRALYEKNIEGFLARGQQVNTPEDELLDWRAQAMSNWGEEDDTPIGSEKPISKRDLDSVSRRRGQPAASQQTPVSSARKRDPLGDTFANMPPSSGENAAEAQRDDELMRQFMENRGF